MPDAELRQALDAGFDSCPLPPAKDYIASTDAVTLPDGQVATKELILKFVTGKEDASKLLAQAEQERCQAGIASALYSASASSKPGELTKRLEDTARALDAMANENTTKAHIAEQGGSAFDTLLNMSQKNFRPNFNAHSPDYRAEMTRQRVEEFVKPVRESAIEKPG
jgi:hypothetical protein